MATADPNTKSSTADRSRLKTQNHLLLASSQPNPYECSNKKPHWNGENLKKYNGEKKEPVTLILKKFTIPACIIFDRNLHCAVQTKVLNHETKGKLEYQALLFYIQEKKQYVQVQKAC